MTRTALGKVVTITVDCSRWQWSAGPLRHRERVTGEDAVSRDVLIHQTQDQGIEAVRPGAGRDDYDQHKGIKRLR